MRKTRLFLASLSALALAFMLGMSPAAAATSTYLPTQACSDPSNSGMGVQGHILTDDAGHIRVDGGAGYVGSNRYVRKIEFSEYNNSILKGTRTITYTGTAHSTGAVLNTPTTYLPWMPHVSGNGATVRIWGVRVGTSTTDICSYAYSLNGY
jgi:hypothetical protein